MKFLLTLILCFSAHAFATSESELPSLFKRKLPKWMERQVESDLAPYKNTRALSKSSIDALAGIEHLKLLRITIKDGKLNFDDHRTFNRGISNGYKKTLQSLHKSVKLPDVDFVLGIMDGLGADIANEPLPIFLVAKNKNCKGYILCPDWEAIGGYESATKKIKKGNSRYKWADKKEKLFWRGGGTGMADISRWTEFPRPQLVLLSLLNPEYLDARLAYYHVNPGGELSKRVLGDYVSLKKHPRYKYLIDVDGNTCTWPHLYALLLSSSLTFKQDSDNIQWFYSAITPYKHYIPFAKDNSDLKEKFEWAKSNDKKCKKIAQRATRFAEENLSKEAVLQYFQHLIEKYSEIQKDVY